MQRAHRGVQRHRVAHALCPRAEHEQRSPGTATAALAALRTRASGAPQRRNTTTSAMISRKAALRGGAGPCGGDSRGGCGAGAEEALEVLPRGGVGPDLPQVGHHGLRHHDHRRVPRLHQRREHRLQHAGSLSRARILRRVVRARELRLQQRHRLPRLLGGRLRRCRGRGARLLEEGGGVAAGRGGAGEDVAGLLRQRPHGWEEAALANVGLVHGPPRAGVHVEQGDPAGGLFQEGTHPPLLLHLVYLENLDHVADVQLR
mmetsp:Transcript_120082/g.334145  ORF Transcript_120082/g.334145 Transcript_120082/m.334145 type:complete len:260 (-) Transcript_120082:442-1221(-)